MKRETLGMPSASGVERFGQYWAVVGDDSPSLFLYDNDWNLAGNVVIADETQANQGRIPKAFKPDYEAICKWIKDGSEQLLIFGSGSKAGVRDSLVIVDSEKVSLAYSISSLYARVRELTGIAPEDFNIEAAEIVDENLLLFNRGTSHIIEIRLEELQNFLDTERQPEYCKTYHLDLPSVNGSVAGFSGAAWWEDRQVIIFSASVENTSNWIDDGDVLGSYIGIWNPRSGEMCIEPISADGAILPVKVESVCLVTDDKDGVQLLAVTDSDGGDSELLTVSLSVVQ